VGHPAVAWKAIEEGKSRGYTDLLGWSQKTSMLPLIHANFLQRLIQHIQADQRFEALLAGGSMVHGGFDEYSDLDLILLVRDEGYAAVLSCRASLASNWGQLLACFTGEHVGEPRLLICLYEPVLHVDLKFVRVSDFVQAVERPLVQWARVPERIERLLEGLRVEWPDRSPDWFEERAWIWLHYAGTKLQRGELFEAMGMLAFFRDQVLGPMLHRRSHRPQRGVRRIEGDAAASASLEVVTSGHDAESISRALRNATGLYELLRKDDPPTKVVSGMPERLLPLLSVS